MGNSLLDSMPRQVADEAFAAVRPGRRMFRHGILYLALAFVGMGVVGISRVAVAQEPRPEIAPGPRKNTKKKDLGPRAVAVLQMSANNKASLLPVAIMIDGKFYDATAYKADPVPMALESGTVYEGERSGNSMGLFTVGSALKANAPNAESPWIGTGVWSAAGTEGASKAVKAESAPVGIDTVDAPPRLTRKTGSGSEEKTPADSAPASAPTSTPSKPRSEDDPPRLSKPASSQGGADSSTTPGSAPAGTPQTSSPGQSKTGDSKSGDSKSGDKNSADDKSGEKKPDAPKAAASDSGAGEGNRPRLRRGKPEVSFADEDIPGYSKPGAAAAAKEASSGKLVATSVQKEPVQLIPAISDAAGPEAKSFTYEWLKGDEDDRRKQMMDMAKDQVRAYLNAQNVGRVPAKAEKPHSTHVVAKKPAEPIFGNVQMVAYDLWTTNQPVIIFSVEAHMPPPPAGAPQSEVENEIDYSILLVAYPDIYNNLRKIYAGVTDKFHLDITPKLELVDAVDADGDGRGELLFRETSDGGTGWIIYKPTADKLWKLFDSLNQE